jgi:protein-tyrosine phosphatase
LTVGGILHVCTGNLCRSPIAELLMTHRLRQRYGPAADAVLVRSAGTGAAPGQPIHPLAAAQLVRLGVESAGFVSRPVDLGEVDRAYLVLTATRKHRDELVTAVPTALRRTFTWRELAWLLTDLDPAEIPGRYPQDRLQHLAQAAQARRGYLQPPPPGEFDVIDPIGRTERLFHNVAAQISAAVQVICDAL